MKRVIQLICALVVAGWLLPSAAWGQIGKLPIGPVYEGRTLIVTSHVIGTDIVCAINSELYEVTIVGGVPAIRTTVAVDVGTGLSPGDRFDLTTPIQCDPQHDTLQMIPK